MKIKRNLFNNWQSKIVSIFIAFGLFLYVSGIRNSERVVNIPLIKNNHPKFLVAVKSLPKYVKVKIIGPMSKISLIDPANIKAAIDMRTAKYGDNTFYVVLKYDNYYNDISVEKIDDEVQRKMDFLRTKIVPLSIKTKNNPHKYYKLAGVDIEPRQIKISGPKSVIDKIRQIKIKPININGIAKSLTEQVKVDFKGANVEIEDERPIVVNIEIKVIMGTKMFKNVAVRPVNLLSTLDVAGNKLPTVNIQAKGEMSILDKMDEDDIKTIVNLSRIRRPGRYFLPVTSTISTSSISIKHFPRGVTIDIVKE